MTTTITTRDPVQGLVDYVLDIKPFHTKILEVWVEYIYNDPIHATIKDELDWEIYIDFDRMTGCKYGWDTSPWDQFWNVKSQDEIVTGNFTYKEPQGTKPDETFIIKTISKFDAYRLFFEYLGAQWKARNGEVLPPSSDAKLPTNPFRALFANNTATNKQIIEDCMAYWPTVDPTDYWYEPTLNRLYVYKGHSWIEQPFFYSSVRPELQTPPQSPQTGDYWFDTNTRKLYFYMRNGWSEIFKFQISAVMPPQPANYPKAPESWASNWDYPTCTGPMGENHVYGRVNDLLTFEHGSEIFLFDHVRTAVVDPTGRDMSLSEYTQHNVRREHPIKWRTTVIQTSRNRYKMKREEISVITEPNNPEIKNTTWTIDLNGYDFEGWDIERTRTDVKLGKFLTWKHTDAGTKLIKDDLINDKTFRFRVSDGLPLRNPEKQEDPNDPTKGNLIIRDANNNPIVRGVKGDLVLYNENLVNPKTNPFGDVPSSWVNGTIVYVRSTDDLPAFNLPATDGNLPFTTTDAYKESFRRPGETNAELSARMPSRAMTSASKSLRLERYRPYRVVKKTDYTFSLAFADLKTLEFDTESMGSQTSLTFLDGGSGLMHIGIGFPVPFMEIHQHLADTITAKKTREVLASPMEVFEGFSPSEIRDIAIGYPGKSGTYTGFVVEGNFIGHKQGSLIQVGGSPSKANDGMWTVDKVAVYTNQHTSFSATGVGVLAPKPAWWDISKMGAWPVPVKKRQSEIDAMVANGSYAGFGSEYTYETFSLIAVSDGIPVVTQKPHGFVAEPSYNFNEGTGPNAARTTVADKLIFGSLKAIPQPDGTTKFEVEKGVPGMAIVLKDRIKAVIQEGLNRNDPYGGQTIGSYDTPAYGQDTYDENLDTVIQRLGSQ